MRLPVLISVPHAGLEIPPEVKDLCILDKQDIIKDGDKGAAEIYLPLKTHVFALVTTGVARAIIDMNRSEDDRRGDGIVKTHTCWNVPVYGRFPSEGSINRLIVKYHRPYHLDLSRLARGARLGVDCHTMAAEGPPVGPDPGVRRPRICLSNGDGTCPKEWMRSLAECFKKAFKTEIAINQPFKGGYIIRSHARELPWVQVELSREDFLSNEGKSEAVLQALVDWCSRLHK
ncbi:MAG: N-formylglutamate amidohydrolase [Desulfobacteraceae bacterium]|uniref:N-formylglutamate amidohydrolase n=1 Tax=Candidatus Desulfacyla euxinica TaxID=2841693 RepID=A0A8J6N221_9DELT|nr:N-formylglutamate amidohydrolase [Candidatus Desulfacyla euxinica]MBL6977344.1 N-formylglutamate amidohydrolase [Desulfobacteraceae bacterium]